MAEPHKQQTVGGLTFRVEPPSTAKGAPRPELAERQDSSKSRKLLKPPLQQQKQMQQQMQQEQQRQAEVNRRKVGTLSFRVEQPATATASPSSSLSLMSSSSSSSSPSGSVSLSEPGRCGSGVELDDVLAGSSVPSSSSLADALAQPAATATGAGAPRHVLESRKVRLQPGFSQVAWMQKMGRFRRSRARQVTPQELRQHCSVNSLWLSYRGIVYDCTRYVPYVCDHGVACFVASAC